MLSEGDRERILHELFHPTAASRFTCGRTPVGANADDYVVLLIGNELSRSQRIELEVKDRAALVELPPDSVETVTIERSWIAL